MAFRGVYFAGDHWSWRATQFQGMVDHRIVLCLGDFGADRVRSPPNLATFDVFHGGGQHPGQPGAAFVVAGSAGLAFHINKTVLRRTVYVIKGVVSEQCYCRWLSEVGEGTWSGCSGFRCRCIPAGPGPAYPGCEDGGVLRYAVVHWRVLEGSLHWRPSCNYSPPIDSLAALPGATHRLWLSWPARH